MLLISGPSGSGKSTICKRLLADPRVIFSVSATTRPMRPGEVDGRDYHFLSREQFEDKIRSGAFLEWADVYGNLYGTLRSEWQQAVERGLSFLVEIDVQGARSLRQLGIPGLYIFIAPPSFEVLRQRLLTRGTESPASLERRLQKAEDEYKERLHYDHIVINDDLERAVSTVRQLAHLDDAQPKKAQI